MFISDDLYSHMYVHIRRSILTYVCSYQTIYTHICMFISDDLYSHMYVHTRLSILTYALNRKARNMFVSLLWCSFTQCLNLSMKFSSFSELKFETIQTENDHNKIIH